MAPLGRDVGTEGGHAHPITLLAAAQARTCRPASEIFGWGASPGPTPVAEPRLAAPSVDGTQDPSGLRPAKAMKHSPHNSIHSLAAEERAIFAVMGDHYFDDYLTVDLACAKGSAQWCLDLLHDAVRIRLEPLKRKPSAATQEALGVMCNLQRAASDKIVALEPRHQTGCGRSLKTSSGARRRTACTRPLQSRSLADSTSS